MPSCMACLHFGWCEAFRNFKSAPRLVSLFHSWVTALAAEKDGDKKMLSEKTTAARPADAEMG